MKYVYFYQGIQRNKKIELEFEVDGIYVAQKPISNMTDYNHMKRKIDSDCGHFKLTALTFLHEIED